VLKKYVHVSGYSRRTSGEADGRAVARREVISAFLWSPARCKLVVSRRGLPKCSAAKADITGRQQKDNLCLAILSKIHLTL